MQSIVILTSTIRPLFLWMNSETIRMNEVAKQPIDAETFVKITEEPTIVTEDIESLPATFNRRLMLYMRCVVQVLNPTEVDLDFSKKGNLEDPDLDKLLMLCKLFSPDQLLNRCFFEDESKTPESGVTFYPVDHFESLDVPLEIIIGDDTRNVRCIMCCQRKFILEKYHQPMNFYRNRLLALERKQLLDNNRNLCCLLM